MLSVAQSASSRDEMIREIIHHIDNFEHFAVTRYEEHGPEILRVLESLGPQFRVLIADPGLSLRVEEFADYVRANELSSTDAWDARERFSSFLGRRVVYRGIGLTQSAEDALRKNGVFSNALRNGLEGMAFEKSVALQIAERLSNQSHNHDPLISVTRSYGLARAFGALFNNPSDLDKKHVVVIKMTVPDLDLFSHHSRRIKSQRDKYTEIAGTALDNPIEAEELVFLSSGLDEIEILTREPLRNEAQLMESLKLKMHGYAPKDLMRVLGALDSPAQYKHVAAHGLSSVAEEL
jgi:hypothetical protein